MLISQISVGILCPQAKEHKERDFRASVNLPNETQAIEFKQSLKNMS